MAHYLVINTGGTIGMAEGANGLEPKDGEMEHAFLSHPELSGWREHSLEWVHWSPLLDSSDLKPQHWYEIKDLIANKRASVDGVLVIHGTDTLSYTAAALSFLTAELQKTVVITGSMRPISSADTDAIANLNLALKGLEQNSQEVLVAIGAQLMPGSRVTKLSTFADNAFATPGWTASLSEQPKTTPLFITKSWRPAAVGVVTIHPGFPVDMLMSMVEKFYRAIVINAYGNGNAANDRAFRRILKQANEKNIPVFVRSQCFEGNVTFGLYAASSIFDECHAVSCGSMSLEAVVTKVQILCSEFNRSEDVIRYFKQPISREWQ